MPVPPDAVVPHYVGTPRTGDASRHDGRLRPVVGVHEVQVVRSDPAHPDRTDGQPFDFRHHQFIAWWGDRFWVYHLGAEGRSESSKRGMLQWSDDGLTWDPRDSVVAFDRATHQRAAFYVASNGRFLVTTWSGAAEAARGQRGSRLVREVLGPGKLGPVYEIKANARGSAQGLDVPHFDSSPDDAFKVACRELLGDRLYVQQWQEEDQDPAFYVVNGRDKSPMARAFAWYRLADGRIVGMWKGPDLSVDTEEAWRDGTVPVPTRESTTLDGDRLVAFNQFGANGGSKQWGQRTSDGRYAMVFNSPGELHKRWPLAVTTAADGITFDSPLLTISGDIAPQRYADATFDHKDGGPAYVRGIEPCNPQPPGERMWLTYSTNKEDIWVASVPVPIRHAVTGDVADDFTAMPPGPAVPGWNVRSPQLARVSVARDAQGKASLRLSDRDASDYAKAFRVFESSERVDLELELTADQTDHGELHIEVVDAAGERPVRIQLTASGDVTAANGPRPTITLARYAAGEPLRLRIHVDSTQQRAQVVVDDSAPVELDFVVPAQRVERFELRTGAYRLDRFDRISSYGSGFLKTPLDGADADVPEASFRVSRFSARRVRDTGPAKP